MKSNADSGQSSSSTSLVPSQIVEPLLRLVGDNSLDQQQIITLFEEDSDLIFSEFANIFREQPIVDYWQEHFFLNKKYEWVEFTSEYLMSELQPFVNDTSAFKQALQGIFVKIRIASAVQFVVNRIAETAQVDLTNLNELHTQIYRYVFELAIAAGKSGARDYYAFDIEALAANKEPEILGQLTSLVAYAIVGENEQRRFDISRLQKADDFNIESWLVKIALRNKSARDQYVLQNHDFVAHVRFSGLDAKPRYMLVGLDISKALSETLDISADGRVANQQLFFAQPISEFDLPGQTYLERVGEILGQNARQRIINGSYQVAIPVNTGGHWVLDIYSVTMETGSAINSVRQRFDPLQHGQTSEGYSCGYRVFAKMVQLATRDVSQLRQSPAPSQKQKNQLAIYDLAEKVNVSQGSTDATSLRDKTCSILLATAPDIVVQPSWMQQNSQSSVGASAPVHHVFSAVSPVKQPNPAPIEPARRAAPRVLQFGANTRNGGSRNWGIQSPVKQVKAVFRSAPVLRARADVEHDMSDDATSVVDLQGSLSRQKRYLGCASGTHLHPQYELLEQFVVHPLGGTDHSLFSLTETVAVQSRQSGMRALQLQFQRFVELLEQKLSENNIQNVGKPIALCRQQLGGCLAPHVFALHLLSLFAQKIKTQTAYERCVSAVKSALEEHGVNYSDKLAGVAKSEFGRSYQTCLDDLNKLLLKYSKELQERNRLADEIESDVDLDDRRQSLIDKQERCIDRMKLIENEIATTAKIFLRYFQLCGVQVKCGHMPESWLESSATLQNALQVIKQSAEELGSAKELNRRQISILQSALSYLEKNKEEIIGQHIAPTLSNAPCKVLPELEATRVAAAPSKQAADEIGDWSWLIFGLMNQDERYLDMALNQVQVAVNSTKSLWQALSAAFNGDDTPSGSSQSELLDSDVKKKVSRLLLNTVMGYYAGELTFASAYNRFILAVTLLTQRSVSSSVDYKQLLVLTYKALDQLIKTNPESAKRLHRDVRDIIDNAAKGTLPKVDSGRRHNCEQLLSSCFSGVLPKPVAEDPSAVIVIPMRKRRKDQSQSKRKGQLQPVKDSVREDLSYLESLRVMTTQPEAQQLPDEIHKLLLQPFSAISGVLPVSSYVKELFDLVERGAGNAVKQFQEKSQPFEAYCRLVGKLKRKLQDVDNQQFVISRLQRTGSRTEQIDAMVKLRTTLFEAIRILEEIWPEQRLESEEPLLMRVVCDLVRASIIKDPMDADKYITDWQALRRECGEVLQKVSQELERCAQDHIILVGAVEKFESDIIDLSQEEPKVASKVTYDTFMLNHRGPLFDAPHFSRDEESDAKIITKLMFELAQYVGTKHAASRGPLVKLLLDDARAALQQIHYGTQALNFCVEAFRQLVSSLSNAALDLDSLLNRFKCEGVPYNSSLIKYLSSLRGEICTGPNGAVNRDNLEKALNKFYHNHRYARQILLRRLEAVDKAVYDERNHKSWVMRGFKGVDASVKASRLHGISSGYLKKLQRNSAKILGHVVSQPDGSRRFDVLEVPMSQERFDELEQGPDKKDKKDHVVGLHLQNTFGAHTDAALDHIDKHVGRFKQITIERDNQSHSGAEQQGTLKSAESVARIDELLRTWVYHGANAFAAVATKAAGLKRSNALDAYFSAYKQSKGTWQIGNPGDSEAQHFNTLVVALEYFFESNTESHSQAVSKKASAPSRKKGGSSKKKRTPAKTSLPPSSEINPDERLNELLRLLREKSKLHNLDFDDLDKSGLIHLVYNRLDFEADSPFCAENVGIYSEILTAAIIRSLQAKTAGIDEYHKFVQVCSEELSRFSQLPTVSILFEKNAFTGVSQWVEQQIQEHYSVLAVKSIYRDMLSGQSRVASEYNDQHVVVASQSTLRDASIAIRRHLYRLGIVGSRDGEFDANADVVKGTKENPRRYDYLFNDQEEVLTVAELQRRLEVQEQENEDYYLHHLEGDEEVVSGNKKRQEILIGVNDELVKSTQREFSRFVSKAIAIGSTAEEFIELQRAAEELRRVLTLGTKNDRFVNAVFTDEFYTPVLQRQIQSILKKYTADRLRRGGVIDFYQYTFKGVEYSAGPGVQYYVNNFAKNCPDGFSRVNIRDVEGIIQMLQASRDKLTCDSEALRKLSIAYINRLALEFSVDPTSTNLAKKIQSVLTDGVFHTPEHAAILSADDVAGIFEKEFFVGHGLQGGQIVSVALGHAREFLPIYQEALLRRIASQWNIEVITNALSVADSNLAASIHDACMQAATSGVNNQGRFSDYKLMLDKNTSFIATITNVNEVFFNLNWDIGFLEILLLNGNPTFVQSLHSACIKASIGQVRTPQQYDVDKAKGYVELLVKLRGDQQSLAIANMLPKGLLEEISQVGWNPHLAGLALAFGDERAQANVHLRVMQLLTDATTSKQVHELAVQYAQAISIAEKLNPKANIFSCTEKFSGEFSVVIEGKEQKLHPAYDQLVKSRQYEAARLVANRFCNQTDILAIDNIFKAHQLCAELVLLFNDDRHWEAKADGRVFEQYSKQVGFISDYADPLHKEMLINAVASRRSKVNAAISEKALHALSENSLPSVETIMSGCGTTQGLDLLSQFESGLGVSANKEKSSGSNESILSAATIFEEQLRGIVRTTESVYVSPATLLLFTLLLPEERRLELSRIAEEAISRLGDSKFAPQIKVFLSNVVTILKFSKEDLSNASKRGDYQEQLATVRRLLPLMVLRQAVNAYHQAKQHPAWLLQYLQYTAWRSNNSEASDEDVAYKFADYFAIRDELKKTTISGKMAQGFGCHELLLLDIQQTLQFGVSSVRGEHNVVAILSELNDSDSELQSVRTLSFAAMLQTNEGALEAGDLVAELGDQDQKANMHSRMQAQITVQRLARQLSTCGETESEFSNETAWQMGSHPLSDNVSSFPALRQWCTKSDLQAYQSSLCGALEIVLGNVRKQVKNYTRCERGIEHESTLQNFEYTMQALATLYAVELKNGFVLENKTIAEQLNVSLQLQVRDAKEMLIGELHTASWVFVGSKSAKHPDNFSPERMRLMEDRVATMYRVVQLFGTADDVQDVNRQIRAMYAFYLHHGLTHTRRKRQAISDLGEMVDLPTPVYRFNTFEHLARLAGDTVIPQFGRIDFRSGNRDSISKVSHEELCAQKYVGMPVSDLLERQYEDWLHGVISRLSSVPKPNDEQQLLLRNLECHLKTIRDPKSEFTTIALGGLGKQALTPKELGTWQRLSDFVEFAASIDPKNDTATQHQDFVIVLINNNYFNEAADEIHALSRCNKVRNTFIAAIRKKLTSLAEMTDVTQQSVLFERFYNSGMFRQPVFSTLNATPREKLYLHQRVQSINASHQIYLQLEHVMEQMLGGNLTGLSIMTLERRLVLAFSESQKRHILQLCDNLAVRYPWLDKVVQAIRKLCNNHTASYSETLNCSADVKDKASSIHLSTAITEVNSNLKSAQAYKRYVDMANDMASEDYLPLKALADRSHHDNYMHAINFVRSMLLCGDFDLICAFADTKQIEILRNAFENCWNTFRQILSQTSYSEISLDFRLLSDMSLYDDSTNPLQLLFFEAITLRSAFSKFDAAYKSRVDQGVYDSETTESFIYHSRRSAPSKNADTPDSVLELLLGCAEVACSDKLNVSEFRLLVARFGMSFVLHLENVSNAARLGLCKDSAVAVLKPVRQWFEQTAKPSLDKHLFDSSTKKSKSLLTEMLSECRLPGKVLWSFDSWCDTPSTLLGEHSQWQGQPDFIFLLKRLVTSDEIVEDFNLWLERQPRDRELQHHASSLKQIVAKKASDLESQARFYTPMLVVAQALKLQRELSTESLSMEQMILALARFNQFLNAMQSKAQAHPATAALIQKYSNFVAVMLQPHHSVVNIIANSPSCDPAMESLLKAFPHIRNDALASVRANLLRRKNPTTPDSFLSYVQQISQLFNLVLFEQGREFGDSHGAIIECVRSIYSNDIELEHSVRESAFTNFEHTLFKAISSGSSFALTVLYQIIQDQKKQQGALRDVIAHPIFKTMRWRESLSDSLLDFLKTADHLDHDSETMIVALYEAFIQSQNQQDSLDTNRLYHAFTSALEDSKLGVQLRIGMFVRRVVKLVDFAQSQSFSEVTSVREGEKVTCMGEILRYLQQIQSLLEDNFDCLTQAHKQLLANQFQVMWQEFIRGDDEELSVSTKLARTMNAIFQNDVSDHFSTPSDLKVQVTNISEQINAVVIARLSVANAIHTAREKKQTAVHRFDGDARDENAELLKRWAALTRTVAGKPYSQSIIVRLNGGSNASHVVPVFRLLQGKSIDNEEQRLFEAWLLEELQAGNKDALTVLSTWGGSVTEGWEVNLFNAWVTFIDQPSVELTDDVKHHLYKLYQNSIRFSQATGLSQALQSFRDSAVRQAEDRTHKRNVGSKYKHAEVRRYIVIATCLTNLKLMKQVELNINESSLGSLVSYLKQAGFLGLTDQERIELLSEMLDIAKTVFGHENNKICDLYLEAVNEICHGGVAQELRKLRANPYVFLMEMQQSESSQVENLADFKLRFAGLVAAGLATGANLQLVLQKTSASVHMDLKHIAHALTRKPINAVYAYTTAHGGFNELMVYAENLVNQLVLASQNPGVENTHHQNISIIVHDLLLVLKVLQPFLGEENPGADELLRKKLLAITPEVHTYLQTKAVPVSVRVSNAKNEVNDLCQLVKRYSAPTTLTVEWGQLDIQPQQMDVLLENARHGVGSSYEPEANRQGKSSQVSPHVAASMMGGTETRAQRKGSGMRDNTSRASSSLLEQTA